MKRPATPEQRCAIEALDRDVLLEAGAGTGKTRVLVDRYCDAATEVGIEGIVAFTFTERAAAELRHRIRIELGRRAAEAAASGEEEQARELEELAAAAEGARISTIHGFCRRLLSGHPGALGLDPRFRVLDETEADRIAGRAFDEALEELLAGEDPGFGELVAAIGLTELRNLVRTAHDELRSQGRETVLPTAPEPAPGAAIAALAAAASAAVAEASGGRGSQGNHDLLAAAAALDPAELPSEARIAALELSSSAQAFSGPACEEYKRAWARARSELAEREASDHYRRIAALLSRFAQVYAERKAERSGLDFEDLQLEARRLLDEHPRIAAGYRERFRHVMVDEFQDTNPLQLDLVRLLRGPVTRVFCVGDEFQAIYGFRHADVEVFRRERRRFEALPDSRAEVMPLSGNFRSVPEIVASANAVGEALLDGFAPLTIGEPREAADRSPDPRVELLLTAESEEWKAEELGIKVRGDYPSPPVRIAEARLLAARLRQLADAGVPRGEMVVLLRAFTHVAAFEEELERAGLRPYVVGGRGYWSQQQVDDVRRLLGIVANPLDDECLLGVLASPACGVRPDVLWLLRRATRAIAEAEGSSPRRHLWPLVERCFGPERSEPHEAARPYLEAIPAEDAERLRSLCSRLAELREQGTRLSLEFLIEGAIAAFGYDLATLMSERGTRRYANVRKLMRLGREFEQAEGRDLRGFLDYLSERAGRDREGEAATEAEGHDGVRVMTVHAAKGLEFPVVAVADLGRGLLAGVRRPPVAIEGASPVEGNGDRAREPTAGNGGAGRVGIRLARFGAKAIGVFGYDELVERAEGEEAAESCRLAYVAATRAADRLILSGCYKPERLAKPAEVRPGTPVSERLMRALGIPVEGEDGVIEVSPPEPRPGLEGRFPAGRIAVRFGRPDPEAFAALAPRPAAERGPQPELGPPPLARPRPVEEPAAGHLSYSALAVYGRCGYRFFAERVLGLPGAEAHPDGNGAEAASAGRFGFGRAVHALLEWSARHGWREPGADLCRQLLRRERLESDGDELERGLELVRGWLRSDLCREVAANGSRVRPEMPFVLPLAGSVVRGTMDLYVERRGEPPLVIDYKTDSLAGADLEALVDRYGIQRQVYALAGARGAERIRTAYVFLERPGFPVEAELDGAALAAARAELERLIASIREGRFPVTESPHRALCRDCPARERLCLHPPERTGRPLA